MHLDHVNNNIGLRIKTSINSEYSVYDTILSFLTIYSTKTYAQEDEHAEFIAYYSETFSSPPSLELEKGSVEIENRIW